ncbi:hypothetical protein AB2S62_07085 [Vibrio sp. NTOU-M3]|uniref:hypothetical protein n=1 Tax=Vibrio sp. NTOU-M3 TaxID=3234954 RepID=UPI00349F0CC1
MNRQAIDHQFETLVNAQRYDDPLVYNVVNTLQLSHINDKESLAKMLCVLLLGERQKLKDALHQYLESPAKPIIVKSDSLQWKDIITKKLHHAAMNSGLDVSACPASNMQIKGCTYFSEQFLHIPNFAFLRTLIAAAKAEALTKLSHSNIAADVSHITFSQIETITLSQEPNRTGQHTSLIIDGVLFTKQTQIAGQYIGFRPVEY